MIVDERQLALEYEDVCGELIFSSKQIDSALCDEGLRAKQQIALPYEEQLEIEFIDS